MTDTGKYRTWMFDCDGIIFDSNDIKTRAFYEVALPYGRTKADAIVRYHKRFGGESRYKKLRYFFEHILKMERFDVELENALKLFGRTVRKKMAKCPETKGLRLFLKKLPRSCYRIVVSGSAQDELRDIFAKRGLDGYFDAVYGSPDTKESILVRELKKGKVSLPAVFVGDTKYDHQCARAIGSDFIFMSRYTEFEGWRRYCKAEKISAITDLRSLRL
jgi:phosphoglycolate phosphatase-like HAD superfamily hydrolase